MELQNDQKDKKVSIADQMDASGVTASFPAEPVEDMELNEEQLDIISGGGSDLGQILKG
ncbi:hypothetical protein [Spirosoma fluviale]|uniref:Uncharacterized protein n=1 Tax=Spirosoma fluviale TaxID=1597977 RepID=A0A286F595_9BACT|nr:hypothetical protein [Spirosoma fluviale]SOD78276.1 hypothetical protein SAMN06269250_0381 [Spirosoma fluviale]